MQYRRFAKLNKDVSTIGFGAWAIGGAWGTVNDETSLAALRRAVDRGINFFDTADVYGDGRSERLIAQMATPELVIATKAGRRLPKQTPEGYSRQNLVEWTERSRKNLGTRCLDMVQLHCPPTDVYRTRRVFDLLEELRASNVIRAYGVSVETIEQAKLALEYPIASIQIIFNLFRVRPADELFAPAQERRVAIIARVPLASGLLTGKVTRDRKFAADDHRAFNRNGERFDVGETFSGVPLEAGLAAVEELKRLVPRGWTLAQFALRWILMHDAVTTVIPGLKTPEQVDENAAAADLPPLRDSVMADCRAIYDRLIRTHVHPRW
jgi:aryl-alcohol dehydrogenase-like predicted oxidoreductase